MNSMTALVMTANKVKAVDVEKALWMVSSIGLSMAAVNVVPLLCGAVAFYAAGKAGNKILQVAAVVSAIAGVILGVMAGL
jgi:hypothetical protein